MGSEIAKTEFSEEDFREFRQNLRQETRILMEWFSSDVFEKNQEMCGFELEGWIVDRHCAPAPRNEEFLRRVNNPLVVPELSKYNFELNITPHPLDRNLPAFLNGELQKLWQICTVNAREMGCNILMTGILPTLQDRMLTLRNISPLQRFHALNREILRLRSSNPLKIHIEGTKDTLEIVHHDVMAEAATTSLQIHFQVPPGKAAAFYNIAHVLSAPMVALTANSPFLFGRELWDETRIPLFEQAVKSPAFVDLSGRMVSRVTFGRDYVRNSLKEVFLENLDGFPVLLPVTFDDSGLDSMVTWTSGSALPVQTLLLQQLIPGAIQALGERGFDSHDLRYYLVDILARRVETRRNGAWWQKTFIERHGPDFRAMTRTYLENQSSNLPVHEWSI